MDVSQKMQKIIDNDGGVGGDEQVERKALEDFVFTGQLVGESSPNSSSWITSVISNGRKANEDHSYNELVMGISSFAGNDVDSDNFAAYVTYSMRPHFLVYVFDEALLAVDPQSMMAEWNAHNYKDKLQSMFTEQRTNLRELINNEGDASSMMSNDWASWRRAIEAIFTRRSHFSPISYVWQHDFSPVTRPPYDIYEVC